MLYTHCKQKHARQQNFSNDILWWKLHNSEYHAMMHLVAAFVSSALSIWVLGALRKIRHHRRRLPLDPGQRSKRFTSILSISLAGAGWFGCASPSPIVIRCISTNCALEDEILWFFIVAMTCKSNSVSLLCHQTEPDKSVIVGVKCRASDRGSRKRHSMMVNSFFWSLIGFIDDTFVSSW